MKLTIRCNTASGVPILVVFDIDEGYVKILPNRGSHLYFARDQASSPEFRRVDNSQEFESEIVLDVSPEIPSPLAGEEYAYVLYLPPARRVSTRYPDTEQ